MKNKIIITALVLLTGAFCSTISAAPKDKKKKNNKKEQQVKLQTRNDSISFAAGMTLTHGLDEFLKLQFGVDSTQKHLVAEGYTDAMEKANNPNFKAYSAGMQVAEMVKSRFLPGVAKDFKTETDSINEAMFHKGFVAGLQSDFTNFNPESSKEYMQEAKRQIDEKRNAANKLLGEAFLQENALKEGVKTLPSGLQYKVIEEGKGRVAKENDDVTVKY